MKIDCSITENYLREKARMTTNCEDCNNCPISFENNGEKINCCEFEAEHQSEAIAIIQKWSDEHPVMTNKEKFVQIMKDVFGVEINIPNVKCSPLGFYSGKNCISIICDDCHAWWNEPYKEPEKKEG